MEIDKKSEVELLLKDILREYIPHIDMVLFNYKDQKYKKIFWYYKEKMESFCHLMNHLYEVIKNNKYKDVKIHETIYTFSKLEEINFYTLFIVLETIKRIIFLPIMKKINSEKEMKKIFGQILVSTKKLIFMNRFLESVITYD